MKVYGKYVQLLFFSLITLFATGCGVRGDNGAADMGAAVPATATMLSNSAIATAAPTEPLAATATALPTEQPAEIGLETAAAPLRIVFLKEGNVWLWQLGAEAIALTQAGDAAQPQISDDGTLVAFSRNGELWSVAADGSNEQRLVDSDTLAQLSPAGDVATLHRFGWLPTTHRLLFNTQRAGTGGSRPTDDLHVVDADTLAYQSLLAAGQGGEFYPAPNGQQIALVTPELVSTVNADGSNYQPARVSYEQVLTYSEYLYYPSVSWASDSSAFAVAIPPTDPFAQPAEQTTIWWVPATGEAAQRMLEISSDPFQRVFAFSPDLRYVAYIEPLAEAALAPALAVTDLQSGEVVTRYAGVTTLYGWSPDGGYLAFLQGSERALAQIAALGQAPQAVPGEAAATLDVHWVAPDQYLYVTQAPEGWEIWLGTIKGESQRVAVVGGELPDFAANR
jgi:hypothetical protein